mmetsp:Transcript_76652/g.194505  ORF Transcript_76652/g.194505 Transcript_76652/m.194505 type:complete len:223 (+) Transcript_76652:152-820(+)
MDNKRRRLAMKTRGPFYSFGSANMSNSPTAGVSCSFTSSATPPSKTASRSTLRAQVSCATAQPWLRAASPRPPPPAPPPPSTTAGFDPAAPNCCCSRSGCTALTAFRKASSACCTDTSALASKPSNRRAASNTAALRGTGAALPPREGAGSAAAAASASPSESGPQRFVSPVPRCGNKKPVCSILLLSRTVSRRRCRGGSHVAVRANISPAEGQCHCNQEFL